MTVPRRHELPPLDETCTLPLCGRKQIRVRRKFKPQGIIVLVAIVFIALRSFLRGGESKGGRPQSDDHQSMPKQLSLKQFPTLVYPLANAKLVALYFGASFYEETRLLRDSFLWDERLLPQEGLPISGKYDLAIIYISSDDVEGSSQWIHVLDYAEKIALKRKFKVGTPQEALELKIDVKFSVPSLVVIDSASNGVMTPMGIVDLKERGSKVLEGWLQFQNTIQGVDPSVWAATELYNNPNET